MRKTAPNMTAFILTSRSIGTMEENMHGGIKIIYISHLNPFFMYGICLTRAQ